MNTLLSAINRISSMSAIRNLRVKPNNTQLRNTQRRVTDII